MSQGEFSVCQFFADGTHEYRASLGRRRRSGAGMASLLLIGRRAYRHDSSRDPHRRRRLHQSGMEVRRMADVPEGGGDDMSMREYEYKTTRWHVGLEIVRPSGSGWRLVDSHVFLWNDGPSPQEPSVQPYVLGIWERT